MERTRPALRGLVAAVYLAAAVFPVAIPSLVGQESQSLAPPGLVDRVSALNALGTRAEGSVGEAAAFAYVERELRAGGLMPTTSDFADASEGYSTSRIVEARIVGALEDELAIMVPVGSWIDSPDPSEGTYGLALALDEAVRLSAKARAGTVFPISIRFVFLGAEKRGKRVDGETASLGSRTWISRQAGRARLAVLYFSLDSKPSRIAVHSAGDGVLSPYWYYEGVRRSLEASGIGYGLEANRLQAYRLGLASDYGPAAPYLEAGIPAIELRGESEEPGLLLRRERPRPLPSPRPDGARYS